MKFERTIRANGMHLQLTLETKDLKTHSTLTNRRKTREQIEQGMSIIAQDIENQLAEDETR